MRKLRIFLFSRRKIYETEGTEKLGMLYFVLGAVLAIAGYFIKSSWLASFGGGVCVLGLVRLLRAARLSRDPEQAADYDASLQDERTAYVANKARSLTFFICIYAQLLAVLAAILVSISRSLAKFSAR